MRTERFTGEPATQIARATATLLERGPIVIGRRDRGMIAVREMSRFALQPRRMRRIRGAHERQRASERVDHFLVVSRLGHEPFGAPTPSRRGLPRTEGRRELTGDVGHLGFGGNYHRALQARFRQHLLGMVRGLRNERALWGNLAVPL